MTLQAVDELVAYLGNGSSVIVMESSEGVFCAPKAPLQTAYELSVVVSVGRQGAGAPECCCELIHPWLEVGR